VLASLVNAKTQSGMIAVRKLRLKEGG